MYVIKHIPEDFAVIEISDVKDEGEGKFSIFRLKKRDLTTYEAVSRLAKLWRVNINDISCAGNKDRQGVTSQVCSVKGVKKEFINNGDSLMSAEFLGQRKEPVHTGELVGNKFCLVVRNVDSIPEIKPKFVNLFGEQRFSKRNSSIGRALIKRDFKSAALMFMEDNASIAPKMKIFVDKNDFIGALRLVQRKLLLLFIHAYQSELWNKAALMSKKDVLPIVGFDASIDDDIVREILREEGITPRDFVVKEFPEVSSEGSQRNVYAEAAGVKVSELSDDEFFPGKRKFSIEFMLPKGSYATEFIRQLFEPA